MSLDPAFAVVDFAHLIKYHQIKINFTPTMLNSKQISYLKGLSHSLNPVVHIGHKGLTDSVVNEIEVSIKAHELIKIKLQEKDKSKRKLLLDEICKKINAQAINLIGLQIVIFKASEPPKILFP